MTLSNSNANGDRSWGDAEKSADQVDIEALFRLTKGWAVDPYLSLRWESFFQDVTEEEMLRQAAALRDLPCAHPATGQLLTPGEPKPGRELPYWQRPGYEAGRARPAGHDDEVQVVVRHRRRDAVRRSRSSEEERGMKGRVVLRLHLEPGREHDFPRSRCRTAVLR